MQIHETKASEWPPHGQGRPPLSTCIRRYAMQHFAVQLNYLPSELDAVLPPTDSRRRPDTRAVGSGPLSRGRHFIVLSEESP